MIRHTGDGSDWIYSRARQRKRWYLMGNGDVYTYSLAHFTEIDRASCQYPSTTLPAPMPHSIAERPMKFCATNYNTLKGSGSVRNDISQIGIRWEIPWQNLYVNGSRKRSKRTFTNWLTLLVSLDSSVKNAPGQRMRKASYAKLESCHWLTNHEGWRGY